MEFPEENLSKQMLSRFRQQHGAKPSMEHLTNLLNMANNISRAAEIARPVPREVLDQAADGVSKINTALELHKTRAKLPEILGHLKPGVDAITGVGNAIFKLGKTVHNKLENASQDFPGVYSDVMNTTIGVPQEHLDNFVEEANKGN
jgi:hypothetical protein